MACVHVDRMDFFIRKGTKVPVSVVLDFETVHDDQKKVDFAIYVGENVMCSDNTEIAIFRMEGAIRENFK